MMLSPFILAICVSALGICGASAFKQFLTVRNPIWIVVGVIAYNWSNVGWLMLIDQTGLARATIIASATQILILTLIGNFFGERIGASGWIAAFVMCVVIALTSTTPTDTTPSANKDTQSTPQSQTDLAVDQHGPNHEGR